MRVLFALLAGAVCLPAAPLNLAGQPQDPFHAPAAARVFLFVRTDCPVTNRYAPELQRVAAEFAGRGVQFWLVYPDPADSAAAIRTHLAQYHFPGEPLRDPHLELVKRAQATVSPQAALFDSAGRLEYLGRIDDRFVDFGKARQAAQTHDLEAAIAAVLAGKPVAQPRTKAFGCYLADVQ